MHSIVSLCSFEIKVFSTKESIKKRNFFFKPNYFDFLTRKDISQNLKQLDILFKVQLKLQYYYSLEILLAFILILQLFYDILSVPKGFVLS